MPASIPRKINIGRKSVEPESRRKLAHALQGQGVCRVGALECGLRPTGSPTQVRRLHAHHSTFRASRPGPLGTGKSDPNKPCNKLPRFWEASQISDGSGYELTSYPGRPFHHSIVPRNGWRGPILPASWKQAGMTRGLRRMKPRRASERPRVARRAIIRAMDIARGRSGSSPLHAFNDNGN